ncbi:MAG: hypothetical protein Q7K33_01685 [Candidatus Berkelbacteria bacterium]|nr:hypothetical protein [Candidatus Berkelbacteria bacterium]
MKRSVVVLVTAALLFTGSISETLAQAYYHRTFYEGIDRFELHYFPGGVTAGQAKKLTGGYAALPAGYYGYMKIGTVWRNDIVGYTMIKGQTLADYLKRYGRPVFAIRDQTIDIFGSFKSFLAADPTRYQYGREADYVARDKGRRTARTILAKRGSEIHTIVMRGRDRDCRRRLKKNKLYQKFVFLDGGASLSPSARNPCYLVIRRGDLVATFFD